MSNYTQYIRKNTLETQRSIIYMQDEYIKMLNSGKKDDAGTLLQSIDTLKKELEKDLSCCHGENAFEDESILAFEKVSGRIAFIRASMAAINKLLVRKELVRSDEIKEALLEEIDKVKGETVW